MSAKAMTILSEYTNGNYHVFLFNDGTKLRSTKAKKFKAAFPENIDVKVTNKCSINCPFCHEQSSPTGKDGNWKILTTLGLHSGTELALGGGGLSSLTDIDDFWETIKTLATNGINVNITANILEILKNKKFEEKIIDFVEKGYIKGVGISYNSLALAKVKMVELKDKIPTMVIHTILGVTTKEDYDFLSIYHFKVLILGYKLFGRGVEYFNHTTLIGKNIKILAENLKEYTKNFKTTSFDCLAVEQLNLKSCVSAEEWEKYYMGDDGQFTMYLDLVEMKAAINSTTLKERRISINSILNRKTILSNIVKTRKSKIEQLFAAVK